MIFYFHLQEMGLQQCCSLTSQKKKSHAVMSSKGRWRNVHQETREKGLGEKWEAACGTILGRETHTSSVCVCQGVLNKGVKSEWSQAKQTSPVQTW